MIITSKKLKRILNEMNKSIKNKEYNFSPKLQNKLKNIDLWFEWCGIVNCLFTPQLERYEKREIAMPKFIKYCNEHILIDKIEERI